MADDDEFTPRLGRQHASRGPKMRRYAGRVIAAANLARGAGLGGKGKGGFSGHRNGRGAGVGRLLASRDQHGAFRQRRVVVKARIVRLAGKGAGRAAAHLRYLQRDGTDRAGERSTLYGPEQDRADGKEFLSRGSEDRHQFRFIVAPEDGEHYEELKPLVRRLMTQMEEDLNTRLDWVAVDHFNTGRPHSHILLRGVDERGDNLIIARDYIGQGLRERAGDEGREQGGGDGGAYFHAMKGAAFVLLTWRPGPAPGRQDSAIMTEKLTHFDERGAARMVDVGAKEVTHRVARAGGRIAMQRAMQGLLT